MRTSLELGDERIPLCRGRLRGRPQPRVRNDRSGKFVAVHGGACACAVLPLSRREQGDGDACSLAPGAAGKWPAFARFGRGQGHEPRAHTLCHTVTSPLDPPPSSSSTPPFPPTAVSLLWIPEASCRTLSMSRPRWGNPNTSFGQRSSPLGRPLIPPKPFMVSSFDD